MVFGRYDFATSGSFFAYAGCSLIIPVALVPMARELGFPLDEGGMSLGGLIHASRSLAIVISMLGCGFLAGHWGIRLPLGLSLVIMACGAGVAAISPTYSIVLVAATLAGLGEGVIEALATPAIHRLHPEEPGRYINFTHGFWSVGVVSSVLLAGWLLSAGVSWRWVVGGAGVLALFPAALFLVPGRGANDSLDAVEKVHWRTILSHGADICRRPRFWLFFGAMIFAGGGEFGLTFWAASYVQLEFTDQSWAGGAGTACFAGGMIVSRIGWGYLVVQRRLLALILGSAIVGAAVCIPLTWVQSLGWLYFLLFVAGIAAGPFWPSIQSYASDRLPVDETMLFILLSCAGIPGCGLFTWLLGAVGDAYGLRVSFFLIPACFVCLALLLAFERLRPRKSVAHSQAPIAD
jgi:MFS family permease